MFEIVERSFIAQDKVIRKHKTIDEALKEFEVISNRYKEVLKLKYVKESNNDPGYIHLLYMYHNYGLIMLGIREVK